MLPLKILRDRNICRVPNEQHGFNSTILNFGLEVTGIIMKITVMREKYMGDIVVTVMRIVAFDKRAARKVISDLEEPGH
jgi:hypothetical protein